MKLLLFFLFLFFLSTCAEKARFDNYRVYRIIPKNEKQVKALKSLQQTNEYNFWTESRRVNKFVDIMVPPHKRDEFKNFVEANGLEGKINIENVQSLIDKEDSVLRARKGELEWTNYHNLDEIYAWLEKLAKTYPKTVKLVVGGKSYEGRPIKGIEINFGTNLTGVFIESGIHAREWIAPAGTTWVINEILKNSADPIFRKFNYLYFPVYNPDGYVYSWNTNRLWRKTRTPYKIDNRTCYGADPNRNWDCHWGEVGASNHPCSDIYGGPKVFSEIETKTLSDYLNIHSEKRRQKIFLAFHSYSELVLYPWGYTMENAPHIKYFRRFGRIAVDAIYDVHKTNFDYGDINQLMYPTSGTSIEWYYQQFNGTVSFIYEMRDGGEFGFLLPPKFIIPCGEEHLASLKSILENYHEIVKQDQEF